MSVVAASEQGERCYVLVERGTTHKPSYDTPGEMLERVRQGLVAACAGPGFAEGEVAFRQEALDVQFPLPLSKAAAEANSSALEEVCCWYELVRLRAGIVDTLPHLLLVSQLCDITGRTPDEVIAEAFSRLP